MALLIAGLIVFLGVHSVRIFADNWRTAQIARMGPTVWKGGYALLSLIGLVLIVYGYGLARQSPDRAVHGARMDPALGCASDLGGVCDDRRGLRSQNAHQGTNQASDGRGRQGLGVCTSAGERLIGRRDPLRIFPGVGDIQLLSRTAPRSRCQRRLCQLARCRDDLTAVAIGGVAWLLFTFWLHGWLIGVRPLV